MKHIKEWFPLVVAVVCVGKVAISQEISFASALVLLIGVAAYAFHSYLEAAKDDRLNEVYSAFDRVRLNMEVAVRKVADDVRDLDTEVFKLLEGMDSRISAIHHEVECFKPLQEQVAKSAEDIKRVISTTHLSQTLYQRQRKREGV